MGYGYDVQGPNDRRINLGKKIVTLASTTALPGALLVNDLPFCECSPFLDAFG
jgi:hypothetical protein